MRFIGYFIAILLVMAIVREVRGAEIDYNNGNGEIILRDGQFLRVDPSDRDTAQSWETGDEITVDDGTATNEDTGETAEVTSE